MKKLLYLDVETTGLNSWSNDIIQIAIIIEIDGEVKEEFTSTVKPFNPDKCDPKALAIHGYTKVDFEGFVEPHTVYKQIIELMSKYVDRYSKEDKFTPVGYNVKFDCDFLKSFFRKNGDQYYGSWFNWRMIDPLYLLHYLDYRSKIALPNYKLGFVCKHFNIPVQAHDATSDIKATRKLLQTLNSIL